MGYYRIETRLSDGVVILTIDGFLSDEQVRALVGEQASAEKAVVSKRGSFDLIIDLSSYAPQAAASVEDLSRFATTDSTKARRLAVVTGGALATLQSRRILTRPDAMFFPDLAAAERWMSDS